MPEMDNYAPGSLMGDLVNDDEKIREQLEYELSELLNAANSGLRGTLALIIILYIFMAEVVNKSILSTIESLKPLRRSSANCSYYKGSGRRDSRFKKQEHECQNH